MNRLFLKFISLSVLLAFSGCTPAQEQETTISSTLKMGSKSFTGHHPSGFKLEVLNLDMDYPRVIHFYGDRLFVGSRSGNVYWLDPPYTKSNVLTSLDDYPHSVVIKDDHLYIARTGDILRAPYNAQNPALSPKEFDQFILLPGGNGHNTRTLKTSPDGRLFVSLGIRGNCSDEYLHDSYPPVKRRGGVYKIDNVNGMPTLTPFASGLRNPVGFAWHPDTKELYASNNGSDHSGFDQPPEYFSKLSEGSFHGMPWYQFNGTDIVRDNCIDSNPPLSIDMVTPPVATFPARSAPMDMTFVPTDNPGKRYAGDAIVAIHGSWATADGTNKGTKKSRRPPKLVRVQFENGEAINVIDLVTGFQSVNSGNRWARPMGVAVGPDGHIYFSSDGGAKGLFRLTYLPGQ